MEDRNKLIERVRKLYSMSQETESSPHEAEIAARRVESLRQKHGITEAELATSDYDRGVTDGLKKSPPWRGTLALCIGRVNDCIVHVERSCGFTSLVFSGFAQDVALAQLQFDYIIKQMERHWTEYRATIDRSSKAINNSFKRGYAMQMCDRLTKLADEREVEPETGTALVPMKMAMVETKFGEQKVSNRKGRGVSDGGAYYAGRDAAKRTGINGEIAA